MSSSASHDLERIQHEVTHLVSHKLMNLLTPLVGLADLLDKRPSVVADPQAANLVASLRSSALTARDSVRQLREVQMIEYGIRELNLRPGNLVSLLQSVVTGAVECTNSEPVQLQLDISGSEARVGMDYDVLPLALRHVIRNACEHVRSEEDVEARRVTVRLREGENGYSVDVTNGGKPVPPAFLERFFEKFSTGHTGKPGGIGLGTAFARVVTEAHGGTIRVTSSADAGTTVTISFPRARKETA